MKPVNTFQIIHLKSMLILSFHLCLVFQVVASPHAFQLKLYIYSLTLPANYIPHQYNHPRFDDRNYICWILRIVKFYPKRKKNSVFFTLLGNLCLTCKHNLDTAFRHVMLYMYISLQCLSDISKCSGNIFTAHPRPEWNSKSLLKARLLSNI
jgi:hypothetical protein